LRCQGVNATGRAIRGASVDVREPFEEWNTGASSLLRGRGLPRDRCTQLALLGHAQGCLESRYWFHSREDTALARVAVRFPCTQ
jgi:hypothetical protein